jgi:hypothetical protein
MTWAQRLKRVFNIDVETCTHCGGSVKVIACIENPVVIRKILSHLLGKALSAEPVRLPKSRAPPQAGCSADTPGNLPLCSNGCDSDGSGRASVGLTTGIGWKVSEFGEDFSARTPHSAKCSSDKRARYPCKRLSSILVFRKRFVNTS